MGVLNQRVCRIYLLDDDPFVNEVTTLGLLTEPDLVVVGAARMPEVAGPELARLRPDVVVLDLRFLGSAIRGLDVVAILRGSMPTTRCIIRSARVSPEIVAAARKGGVRGYLCKGGYGLQELIASVRTVFAGRLAFDAESQRHGRDKPVHITRREGQVLRVFEGAPGASDKDLARTLVIRDATVSSHFKNLMRKVGVHDRADLWKWAVDRLP